MLNMNKEPLRLRIKSGVYLRVGQITQLCVEDNLVVVDKCAGMCPLGIIKNIENTNFGISIAEIEYTKCIGKTDCFEHNINYPVNASLFCSPNGNFTTLAQLNYPAIGMVIEPPIEGYDMLRFLWF